MSFGQLHLCADKNLTNKKEQPHKVFFALCVCSVFIDFTCDLASFFSLCGGCGAYREAF